MVDTPQRHKYHASVVAMPSRRIEVRLTPQQYEELQTRSRKLGLPMAEQIRRALDEYLAKEQAGLDWRRDPIWTMVGKVSAPDENVDSERVDEILYGLEGEGTKAEG